LATERASETDDELGILLGAFPPDGGRQLKVIGAQEEPPLVSVPDRDIRLTARWVDEA
jgi:hypothetical protein